MNYDKITEEMTEQSSKLTINTDGRGKFTAHMSYFYYPPAVGDACDTIPEALQSLNDAIQ